MRPDDAKPTAQEYILCVVYRIFLRIFSCALFMCLDAEREIYAIDKTTMREHKQKHEEIIII